jgi:hypothetical protein
LLWGSQSFPHGNLALDAVRQLNLEGLDHAILCVFALVWDKGDGRLEAAVAALHILAF